MPVPDKLQIRQIALEIHGGCNYRCPMCPQAEGRERDFLKKLPFDVFVKIIEEAKQYGLEAVSLQGSGEPTLHSEMPRYVHYVKDQGLKCISLANGYARTPKRSRATRAASPGTNRLRQRAWPAARRHDIADRQTPMINQFSRT